MYSLCSVTYSVLVMCGFMTLAGLSSDHYLYMPAVPGIGDMRISSETVFSRGIPQSRSTVHTTQWLMLLAAMALGVTGASMVLLSNRRVHSKARLKDAEVLPHTRPPLLVRDLDDRIIDWSSEAQLLYGFAPQEALGRLLDDLLRSMYPKPLPEIKGLLLRQGTWSGEIRRRTKYGRSVLVTSRWTLQQNEDGEPVAIAETDADIAGREDSEESLRQQDGHGALLAVPCPLESSTWIRNAVIERSTRRLPTGSAFRSTRLSVSTSRNSWATPHGQLFVPGLTAPTRVN